MSPEERELPTVEFSSQPFVVTWDVLQRPLAHLTHSKRDVGIQTSLFYFSSLHFCLPAFWKRACTNLSQWLQHSQTGVVLLATMISHGGRTHRTNSHITFFQLKVNYRKIFQLIPWEIMKLIGQNTWSRWVDQQKQKELTYGDSRVLACSWKVQRATELGWDKRKQTVR